LATKRKAASKAERRLDERWRSYVRPVCRDVLAQRVPRLVARWRGEWKLFGPQKAAFKKLLQAGGLADRSERDESEQPSELAELRDGVLHVAPLRSTSQWPAKWRAVAHRGRGDALRKHLLESGVWEALNDEPARRKVDGRFRTVAPINDMLLPLRRAVERNTKPPRDFVERLETFVHVFRNASFDAASERLLAEASLVRTRASVGQPRDDQAEQDTWAVAEQKLVRESEAHEAARESLEDRVRKVLGHDSELLEGAERFLAKLSPRDARVLRLYYGLEGGRTHTLEEIGRLLGVNRQRADQLKRRALARLRALSS
jgi:DNA-directed RNA polymerase specialized sigma24 family protein